MIPQCDTVETQMEPAHPQLHVGRDSIRVGQSAKVALTALVWLCGRDRLCHLRDDKTHTSVQHRTEIGTIVTARKKRKKTCGGRPN